MKLCECGCGREIIIKEFHKKYSVPKYINGHYIKNNKLLHNINKEKAQTKSLNSKISYGFALLFCDYCKCGCRRKVKNYKNKINKYIKGHASRYKNKSGKNNSMFGRENKWGHHTEDTKKIISELKKGKKRLDVSERHKFTDYSGKNNPRYRDDITKDKIVNVLEKVISTHSANYEKSKILKITADELKCGVELLKKRCSKSTLSDIIGVDISSTKKNITKNKILDTFKEIIDMYGNKIGRTKIQTEAIKRLNCNVTVIHRVCGNMESILKELNINIKRNISWKKKQDLIEEVISEYDSDLQIQKTFKNIGRPDVVTKNVVYEIKSYLYNGWQKQFDKYSRLNKEVKFVVFEEKGKTDVASDNIIFLKDLINNFSFEKKSLYKEKIERINKNIPLEQTNLVEV